MKKIITTALIVAGFAIAAFAVPNYEVKIVERSAAACDSPSCNGG